MKAVTIESKGILAIREHANPEAGEGLGANVSTMVKLVAEDVEVSIIVQRSSARHVWSGK